MSASSQFLDSRHTAASLRGESRQVTTVKAGAPWAVIGGLLAAAFLVAQLLMQQGWMATGPANDFLTFYSAAGTGDTYSAAALEAARPEALRGLEAGARPYLRLPIHAAFLSPLRALPYPSAYQIYQIVMLWCVVAFVAWWLPEKRSYTLAVTALSLPLFFGFMRGSDLPIARAAFAGCALGIRRRRPFLAGVCLSLAALCPPALLAAPLVIFARRLWIVGIGLFAGLTALILGSFGYGGPEWMTSFVNAWKASPPAVPSSMPNLAGVAAWLGLAPVAVVAAALTAGVAVYAISRRESLTASLGCAMAAGLLIAPRAYLEDAVLLLPAALVLAAEKQPWPVRIGAIVLLTPLGFVGPDGGALLPVFVLLSFAVLLLAAALPSERVAAPARERIVQLGLG